MIPILKVKGLFKIILVSKYLLCGSNYSGGVYGLREQLIRVFFRKLHRWLVNNFWLIDFLLFWVATFDYTSHWLFISERNHQCTQLLKFCLIGIPYNPYNLNIHHNILFSFDLLSKQPLQMFWHPKFSLQTPHIISLLPSTIVIFAFIDFMSSMGLWTCWQRWHVPK